MRILVVEDNRNLVANLFEYFEARGHTLDAAPDGPTGLHLAIAHPYDAVVLDWMLPRMDGPEVLRRLRNDAGSDVPVLMLTARDELPDKIAGFRAGADDLDLLRRTVPTGDGRQLRLRPYGDADPVR